MIAPVVTVEYKLHVSQAALSRHPNAGSGPQPQITHSFPIPNSSTTTSNAVYYQGLAQALKTAVNDVGADLTTWRDAVGNDEKDKEAGGTTSSTEEEEG